jgi:hypothetical protein
MALMIVWDMRLGRLSASLSFDGIMDTRIQLLGKEREKHFYDH